MRIGIFGGSFDPVHSEHIQLAKSAIEDLGLEKLLVMPAYAPPHKKGKILSPDCHRLEMCRLAFASLPQVEVSDFEIQRGDTSYTYLTCEALKSKYEGAELFWLVGADMLKDFPTWRYPERILACVTLAVCSRRVKQAWIDDWATRSWVSEEQDEFYKKFGKNFVHLPYHGKDVSSTKIRVLAGAGMRLTEFLPESVAAYIEEKGLYKIEGAKEALGLEKPSRREHSIRVALLAAARAGGLKIPEHKAIQAAFFHDCGKNLEEGSPYLVGFTLPNTWGEVPCAVAHQFSGAYVAEHTFGITDEDVLNAVRYHTSARPNMSELEKLIFLADMVEEERSYEGVEELRRLFWTGENLDECLKTALLETLLFLRKKGGEVYPLTQKAYEFYQKQ